jgi:uncharacterized repeat protein (TIGR01451 family)
MPPDKKKPQEPRDESAPPKEAAADALGSELGRIYDAPEEDMSRLQQARHSTMKKVLIGLTVFFAALAAVSWAGFFFFSPAKDAFTGDRVAVEIEGADELKSGEMVSFAVRFRNDERVPLGSASLELRLPKAFHVQRLEPASDGPTWQLGSLAPGKDGMVTVHGVFLAPLDKEMDIQAILSYRPADFNSEFQKVSTKTVRIAGSVLELEVTGPPKVLPGDRATFRIAYKNPTENAFDDLRVRAVYPEHFIPESATPDATDERLIEWVVERVEAGGGGEVAVTGSFASAAEGRLEIGGEVGFVGEDGTFQLQAASAFATDVLKGDLVTALILNGRSDEQVVRFGDTLRYAITWKNTGSVTLEDVTLRLVLAPEPSDDVLRWNELEDKARGVREGDAVVWTKRQVPSLGRVEAGDEGTLDITIPLLGEPLDGADGSIYRVSAHVEAVIDRIDAEHVGRQTRTQPLAATLASDAVLGAGARYFNDDNIPVGSGPLPPRVGETTTYRVFWRIENSLHELTDLKLSAKLPPNVSWNGTSEVDAGELRFDAASEKIIWTLNWMPTSVNALDVSFDVALTPSEDQRGKLATLVDATIFEAIDKVIGAPLLLSAPPITTALESDEGAAGKGRVQ